MKKNIVKKNKANNTKPKKNRLREKTTEPMEDFIPIPPGL